MPVLGSGHPQADIMIVKAGPQAPEVEEGVAFYGRAGTALMKALGRLQIDPLAIYGTVLAKCPCGDPGLADPGCVARFAEEFAIVQPKLLVVMGDEAVATINNLSLPMARAIDPLPGFLARLTPSCEVLVTPDIDGSLDDDAGKRAFWSAFRTAGDWWTAHPPY
jgi:uracil-DNA glycosylase family 4